MRTRRTRLLFLTLAASSVPLGLGAKQAAGSLRWISDHAAGALYVAFFVFLILAALPRARAAPTAVGVLLATSLVEVLQLWHPPLLDAARATLPGRLLLGSSFSWTDFPPYGIGAALAGLLAAAIDRGDAARRSV